MNTKHKALYDAPSTSVIKVRIGACIMQTSDYKYGSIDESNVMSSTSESPFDLFIF